MAAGKSDEISWRHRVRYGIPAAVGAFLASLLLSAAGAASSSFALPAVWLAGLSCTGLVVLIDHRSQNRASRLAGRACFEWTMLCAVLWTVDLASKGGGEALAAVPVGAAFIAGLSWAGRRQGWHRMLMENAPASMIYGSTAICTWAVAFGPSNLLLGLLPVIAIVAAVLWLVARRLWMNRRMTGSMLIFLPPPPKSR